MAKKKFFTDASFKSLIDEIKSYINNLISTKANSSHTHTIANVTNLQSTLDGKASSSHNHAASNITSGTLSSDRLPTVPITKGGTGATTASGALTNLGITATASELNVLDGITATTTELNYVDGVTSNIQTQLNGKSASSHTHSYLPLSGGTLSSTSFGALNITRSGSTNGAAIGFINSNGTLGYIGMTSAANGGLLRYSADTNSSYTILDSGNYTGYAAKASHSHATSDITSGTLSSDRLPTVPISKGGTGATTAASALTNLGLTATATELNYCDGVTSNIQTQLNGKSATSHTHSYLPLSGGTLSSASAQIQRAGTSTSWVTGRSAALLKTNTYGGSNGSSAYSPILSAKSVNGSWDLGTYTNDVLHFSYITDENFSSSTNTQTANIQFKKDGSITANTFTGSLSGNATTATTATKLGTSAGSATQPVYFSDGKPVATTYTLAKSVPADAVFTDTNTWRGIQNNLTSTSTTDSLSAAQGTALKALVDGKANSSHSHAATDITSGTLSSDRLPTVPVSKGGTGSTTVAGARASLGTLSATSANGYYGMGLPDGTTSNWIRTTVNGIIPYQSGGSGSLGTSSWPFNNAYINTVYGSLSGNASTATTLATARTIALGTGVTGTATSFNGSANITIPVTAVKEAYLSWGGKNLSGSVSPIDAAASNLHSANRFAFAKAAGITIEYSTDGSTYSTYSTTDSAKINLVSGNGNAYYIGARSTSTTVNDKLRITLDATNMGVYTRLRKLLINISTSYATGSNVIIEKAMKGSETTFSTVGTYSISGWSGWNSIPIECAFGGGSTQTSNIAILRLTFGITGVNSSQTSNALTIYDIVGIGDTYWSYPSTMAKTGHLYTYDSSQNVTFPASITGTGTLSMNRKSGTTVGDYSVAVGYNAEASGMYSHAEGMNTIASSQMAHAEGQATTASGKYSHAEGIGTTASGTASHSQGVGTIAEGMYCHAEGSNTVAKGYQTHAEGNNTTSSGSNSHAEGEKTTTSGVGSHAEGISTNKAESITTSTYNPTVITAWETSKFLLAKGEGSHAEGKDNLALGAYSHAEGQGVKATADNSHSEGYYATASGNNSHAEGNGTTSSGASSHVEGVDSMAIGEGSHAEGYMTEASGDYSHTEGSGTKTEANYGHAEGLNTTVGAYASHAEGESTTASGICSHSEGIGTVASGEAQHVFGKYNVSDTSDTYIEVVGKGSSDSARSNARTLDWSGNEWLAGGLTVDGAFKYKAGTSTTLKPYYTAGDSFTITSLQTAGYLTSSNTEVHFTIPLDRPLIGVSTVTVSTVNGFILRQNNSYTHGSAASTRVSPSSYGSAHYYATHIQAVAKFTTTTNSTNNSAIGIDANIKVTFS